MFRQEQVSPAPSSCNSTTLLHCQFIFTALQKIINPTTSAKGWRQWRPYAPWHSPCTACSRSCLVLVNKLCNPVQNRRAQHKENLSTARGTSSNPHSYWVAPSLDLCSDNKDLRSSVQSCSSSRSYEATPCCPRSAQQPEPTAAHSPWAEAPVCRCSQHGDHSCFSFTRFESSTGNCPTAACQPCKAFGCKHLPRVQGCPPAPAARLLCRDRGPKGQ